MKRTKNAPIRRQGLKTMTEKNPGRPVLFFLLLLFLIFIPPVSSGETVSPHEYAERIRTTITSLVKEEEIIRHDGTSLLSQNLPPGLRIRISDGEEVRVDRKTLMRWFREAGNSPQGRERFRTHLQEVLEQVSTGDERSMVPEIGWNECRSRLDEVYRLEAFRHLKKQEPSPWGAYLARIMERLSKWFGAHFKKIGSLGGSWTEYAAYGIILFLSGFVVVMILRRSGPLGWLRHRTRLGPVHPVAPVPPRDWTSWRKEALEMARQGSFRDAIRALFVSALVEGHQEGWWIYEPETTNREHLARVKGLAERREALTRLICLYERAWYGLGQPVQDTFRDCVRCVEKMEAPA